MTDRPTDCEQNNHLNYRLQITDRPTDCEQNNHLNYRLQIGLLTVNRTTI